MGKQETQQELPKPAKLQVILDLDLTLIQSVWRGEKEGQEVSPLVKHLEFNDYKLFLRPGAIEFIESLSEFATISVFTAGIRKYAEDVLSVVDPRGLIKKRLYREHCGLDNKFRQQIKDVSMITEHLERLVIVDDNPRYLGLDGSTANIYKIKPFSFTKADDCLQECLETLKQIGEAQDVRKILPALTIPK